MGRQECRVEDTKETIMEFATKKKDEEMNKKHGTADFKIPSTLKLFFFLAATFHSVSEI